VCQRSASKVEDQSHRTSKTSRKWRIYRAARVYFRLCGSSADRTPPPEHKLQSSGRVRRRPHVMSPQGLATCFLVFRSGFSFSKTRHVS